MDAYIQTTLWQTNSVGKRSCVQVVENRSVTGLVRWGIVPSLGSWTVSGAPASSVAGVDLATHEFPIGVVHRLYATNGTAKGLSGGGRPWTPGPGGGTTACRPAALRRDEIWGIAAFPSTWMDT